MDRDRVERHAAYTVLAGFLLCVLLILAAPIAGWELSPYDQYVTLIIGFLLREVGLLTVGRGNPNGNGYTPPPSNRVSTVDEKDPNPNPIDELRNIK